MAINIMGNSKWNWLRWIGVLPCAIIMNIIVYLIVFYCNEYYTELDSWNMKYFCPIEASLISGVSFIGTAKYVAPSYKKNVGLFFIVIFLIGTGAVIYKSLLTLDYYELFEYIIFVLGSVVGHIAYKEQD